MKVTFDKNGSFPIGIEFNNGFQKLTVGAAKELVIRLNNHIQEDETPEHKELFEFIEFHAANIYQVGHNHGVNARRMFKGENPKAGDEGWSKYYNKICDEIKRRFAK